MADTMQKLNTMGEMPEQDSNQVVEVQFPSGGKNYSYIGSGNLRAGQTVREAPVTHPVSKRDYVAKNVKVVATHNVAGAKAGDKVGVTNGTVHSIPTGLKVLPGAKDYGRDSTFDVGGSKMTANEYMSHFREGGRMQKLNSFGEVGGNNA